MAVQVAQSKSIVLVAMESTNVILSFVVVSLTLSSVFLSAPEAVANLLETCAMCGPMEQDAAVTPPTCL